MRVMFGCDLDRHSESIATTPSTREADHVIEPDVPGRLGDKSRVQLSEKKFNHYLGPSLYELGVCLCHANTEDRGLRPLVLQNSRTSWCKTLSFPLVSLCDNGMREIPFTGVPV